MPGDSWGTRNRFTPGDKRAVLDRDGHTCQLQYRGCLGVATIVDHRVPLSRWPGDPRDLDNGQAACRNCHDQKSKAESAAGRRASAARRAARLKLPRPAKHPGEWAWVDIARRCY